MKNATNRERLVPPHLSDTELIAYLDGELAHSEIERTKIHLDSCWGCRSRLRSIQANIDRFLRARRTLIPDSASLAEPRVNQFRQRLAQHASEVELGERDLGQRLSTWWNHLRAGGSAVLKHRKPALAVVAAVCLVVALFSDLLSTKVSADTVLLKAQGYESAHRPKSSEVTRTSLRIERISRKTKASRQLAVLTLLRDSQSPALHVTTESVSGQTQEVSLPDTERVPALLPGIFRVELGLQRPFLEYLMTQGWFPDVSVEEFRKLIAGRGSSEAFVRKDNGVFELHYPFAARHGSGITEVTLTVNSEDYSPLRIGIVMQDAAGDEELRLTRTAFAFEPRTMELAHLFSSSETEKITRTLGPLALPKPVPLSYANSRATEDEVAVAEALHKIDACLGEEVRIFPMSDGSLLVHGLVDTGGRRESIKQALKAVSTALPVEIYLPRELKSGSQLYSAPHETPGIVTRSIHPSSNAMPAGVGSQQIPLYQQLYHHFSKSGVAPEETEKQINAFSSEVVTLAQQTFLHAWALKRLDQEFSTERIGGLFPVTRQRIEQMRRDHRRWIVTLSHRQAEMLLQLGSSAATSTTAETSTAGQQDSDTLLRLAQEQNDLVQSLFTISLETAGTSTSLAHLLAVLRQMGA